MLTKKKTTQTEGKQVDNAVVQFDLHVTILECSRIFWESKLISLNCKLWDMLKSLPLDPSLGKWVSHFLFYFIIANLIG
jgi:hypothetical protein